MKIQKISVKKLFGIFDHEINLKKDGITIVIGENGIGKTKILEATRSLLKKEFEFFIDLEFKEFSISFEENNVWRLEKESNKKINQSLFH